MPPELMTVPTQRVLAALLGDPERELYGMGIGEAAELRSGTVHPTSPAGGRGVAGLRWEDIDQQIAGRPARRYYRLTADKVVAARAALAHAYRPSSVRRLRPQVGPA